MPLRFLVPLGVLLLVASLHPRPAAADDWLPITPEELKMTSELLAPDAPAIYLYRQDDTDDSLGRTYNYSRIKILATAGLKQADVEIYLVKELGEIQNIRGRTVNPDGSVTLFDGKVFERTIVKARGIRLLAKTFTLPNVQVGSIIEYKYESHWNRWAWLLPQWTLNDDLFIKRARFSMQPVRGLTLRWTGHRLPPGVHLPQAQDKNVVRMEVENLPAFQTEDYMPPEGEMKARVEFYYVRFPGIDMNTYWSNVAKALGPYVKKFTEGHKELEPVVSQTVAEGDPPDVKLQKLYSRVQRLRNLSYEPSKTEKEELREKLKESASAETVWKHQYGTRWDLNCVYLALVRLAGFDAAAVYVARRDAISSMPGP